MNEKKDLIKQELLKILKEKYKVNASKIHCDMDLLSYPMFLKARDILFLVFSVAQKYDLQLSFIPNEMYIASITSISEYLSDLWDNNL